jgi:hypothetical protein
MNRTEALHLVASEHDRYEPSTLEVNGTPWGCATDGWRMLAIKDVTVTGKVSQSVSDTFARHILAKPSESARVVSRDAFAAWVGEAPIDPERTDCSRCDSEGEVECSRCDGSGECVCECGHEHDCSECDGAGTVRCGSCKNEPETRHQRTVRRRRLGAVAGVPFNRTLFHEALAMIETESVLVETPFNPNREPLLVRSSDGSVVFAVMALDQKLEEGLPELLS